MKATIQIPDNLYRKVKAEAALRGLTIREVTMELYQRWLRGDEEPREQEKPSEWLRTWFASADEALDAAPEGPSARDELAVDRNRLERR